MFLGSRIVALIEAPPQLQVVEPHLQECVYVACSTEVGQANKCVLEEAEKETKRHLDHVKIPTDVWGKNNLGHTLSRRSEFGSSILWKAFSSISPSHACSPMPTRQLGFPLQFLLQEESRLQLLSIVTPEHE